MSKPLRVHLRSKHVLLLSLFYTQPFSLSTFFKYGYCLPIAKTFASGLTFKSYFHLSISFTYSSEIIFFYLTFHLDKYLGVLIINGLLSRILLLILPRLPTHSLIGGSFLLNLLLVIFFGAFFIGLACFNYRI